MTLQSDQQSCSAHVAAYPMPNVHVSSSIGPIISASTGTATVEDSDFATESRTELDSHANMCVVGRYATIVNTSGRHAEVNAFSPEIKSLHKVPIVDAAIAYDCPYSMKTFILIIRNALHVPSMDHNLIPPFVMREAGIEVNEMPKIHAKDATTEHHSIYFQEQNLRIPLALWGIFSYFPSRKPSNEDLRDFDFVLLTPDGPDWNPHSDAFARNEESYLDWRGDLIEPKDRMRVLIDDRDYTNDAYISGLDATECNQIDLSPTENVHIDEVCAKASEIVAEVAAAPWEHETPTINEVNIQLGQISSTLDPGSFVANLEERAAMSHFGMSVGSMHGAPDDYNDLFSPGISAAHAEPPKGVSAKHLSKIWKIDLDTAKRTLEVTSQRCKHDTGNPLTRNYSTNDRMLRYRRIKTHFFTDTFFVTKKAKSSRGNTCMQLFVSDMGFVFVVAMKSKGDFVHALKLFFKEVGVPDALVCDPSGEQTSRKSKQLCNQVGTTLRVLEEHTQWANRAELYVGLFKGGVMKDMKSSDSPLVLWDYCAERRARIHNLTARDLFQLHGQNPVSATLGDEGDISNLCVFDWYDWGYFRDQSTSFPEPKEVLCKVLGPSRNVGNEMTQWVLKSNGQIVPRRTVRPLLPQEIAPSNEIEQRKRDVFAAAIRQRYGDSMNLPPDPDPNNADYVPYVDNDDETEPTPLLDDEDPVDNQGRPISEQPLFDRLINAELTLPQGEEMRNARVLRRSKDLNGNIIGTYDDNPMLNTIVYDVEFPDGAVKQYAANTIADNMYAQVDSEGYQHSLLDSIIDFGTDGNAIVRGNEFVVTRRGRRRLRKTTVGWKLLVAWKDGSEQWIPLSIMKESNPVEVAEFAKSCGLLDEPAFKWWAPYTLKKRDRIIASVKTRVRKATHKYGVKIPTSTEHALKIDERNGNTLWRDALKKEMYNVSIAFEILDSGEKAPPGWTRSSGHIIFDVKMDFTRKARWVKDGHKTPDPEWSTYAGFVSRESVRIALTYAALNDLGIVAADIKNAYLQAPASEKHYIVCGTEFGLEHEGKVALIC